MLISIIISTYNWPQALNKVLEALQEQTDRNFEIVIADDGSGIETKKLIQNWIAKSKVKVIHAWQPDEGFRVSESRNNAVRACHGDYLVFIDGDCIPRKHFVEHQRALAEKGYVVAGNRCLLSASLTATLLTSNKSFHFPFWKLCLLRIKGDLNRLDALITLPPNSFFRYRHLTKWQKLRGCNIGVWRQDFERVNGFDSSFVGWGFEDSDLAARLINAGVKIKNGAFSTALLHLYHRESDEIREGHNWERLQYVLSSNCTQPVKGLK